jgi:hypothetical protein
MSDLDAMLNNYDSQEGMKIARDRREVNKGAEGKITHLKEQINELSDIHSGLKYTGKRFTKTLPTAYAINIMFIMFPTTHNSGIPEDESFQARQE